VADVAIHPPRLQTQQIAWGVLLIAFAVFCVVCLISGLGIQYFLFESSVPMPAMLVVSRGTAILTEADMVRQAELRGRELWNSALVSTDSQSQAMLSFLDRHRNDMLVASITLRSNSSLDLDKVSRPRFEWSSDEYHIDLGDIYGEFEITIPENLGREIRLVLDTQRDALVYLTKSGRYAVNATDTEVIVSNFSGEALLITPDRIGQTIEPGQRGAFYYDTQQLTSLAGYTDLLGSEGLGEDTVLEAANVASGGSFQAWRCTHVQNVPTDPLGSYGFEIVDGRWALRLLRGGGTTSHADTSCTKSFTWMGQDGLDVSGYDYLALRTTFKIMSHSLSVCGTQGSECPLMLRMDYVPQSGGAAVSWIHGFYSFILPGTNNPPRCDSCPEVHDIIRDNAWYSYDTGNLMVLLPQQLRPRSILNLRFYASGHEYDVYMSDIALLAGEGTVAGG
jgi:hypothetical protein